MITVAASSDLVGSYHSLFDGIFNSAAGQVLTKIGAAIAVLLALGLIIAALCKALGRQNKLVSTFCPNVGRVLVVLAVAFICAGPLISLPAILTCLDWFMNAIGNQGKDYLGI